MVLFRHLAYAVGVALLLGAASDCAAQTADSGNAAALQQRDDEMRLVNALLDGFWEVMNDDERAILQEIDVRIPMDYDITRVVAYRDPGRVIEVSFGFFGMLIELSDDQVLADYYSPQDPDIYDKFEAYLTSLNDAIDRNEQSFGQNQEALPRFAPFAGIPAETAAEFESREDFKTHAGNLRMAGIAFVMAHEIGHHVLGHADSPPPESAAESRARETEADRYAAELTMRIGVPAFGALPALALFGAAEGETVDPDATHPLATCRILGALLYSVDRLAADERTVHLLDQIPEMMPGGSQYNAFTTTMNEQCQ